MPVPHLYRTRAVKKRPQPTYCVTEEEALAKAIKSFKGLWFWQRWLRLKPFWTKYHELEGAMKFCLMRAKGFQTCPVRKKSLLRKLFYAQQLQMEIMKWDELSQL